MTEPTDNIAFGLRGHAAYLRSVGDDYDRLAERVELDPHWPSSVGASIAELDDLTPTELMHQYGEDYDLNEHAEFLRGAAS